MYWSKIWPIWKSKLLKSTKKGENEWPIEIKALVAVQYNQYFVNEWRKKNSVIDRQKITLWNEKAKIKATDKCLFEIRNKNIMNRPATLYEVFLVKSSASKDQIKKPHHKMSLLKHPYAGGDKEFFKIINRTKQILTNDAVQEAYNKFGHDWAEKVMNNEIWQLNCPYEHTTFSYSNMFI